MNEDSLGVNAYNDFKSGQYAYLKTLSTKSNTIYNLLLIFLIAFIASLPFIHVRITGQAYFVMQPKQAIESIFSPVAGRIKTLNVSTNTVVVPGDTILAIETNPFLNGQAGGERKFNNGNGKDKGSATQAMLNNTLQSGSPITANVAGVGNIMENLQPGTYVQAGQKLAEVLPDSSLTVVCYVAPNEIGYFKPGQRIKLQIDAYNYYDWGMLEASVTEVNKNVTLLENRPFYRVHCKADKSFLTLKNGYVGTITKGMTGRANFEKSERTLWQLLFTKVNEWFNPNAK